MTMLVAIAEDEEILARALKEKFESEGFQVLIARNGQEALDFLKSGSKPDLFLLDLIMPVIDGFAVLEAMYRDPNLRNIPVIVLSNLGEDESIKRALKLGAVDYFVKAQHAISDVVAKVKQILLRQSSEKGSFAGLETPPANNLVPDQSGGTTDGGSSQGNPSTDLTNSPVSREEGSPAPKPEISQIAQAPVANTGVAERGIERARKKLWVFIIGLFLATAIGVLAGLFFWIYKNS